MTAFLPLLEAERLHDNLEAVLARISEAAGASGRDPADVTLVSVAKLHSAAAVAELARIWPKDRAGGKPAAVGENYLQEALAKRRQLELLAPESHVAWHFVGHVQSRKAKDIPGNFGLLHTLDSEKLAKVLQKSVRDVWLTQPEATTPQRVLLQVNIGGEEQKHGVHPNEARNLAALVGAMPELALEGLMCIPPAEHAPERSRPYFSGLRQLRDRLEDSLGIPLPHLSMGMSRDFAIAIAEGATIVRVGTDIFGERDMRAQPAKPAPDL